MRMLAKVAAMALAPMMLAACSFSVLPGLERVPSENVQRLERTLEYNPNHVHANFLRGRAALTAGEPKIAAEHFRRATEGDLDFEEAWNGLGVAYLDIKKYKEAEVIFRQMVVQFPDSPLGHEGLAAAALKQDNISTAADEAKAALAIDQDAAYAHRYLGEALYTQEDLPGALKHWRRAIELDQELKTELRPIVEDLENYLSR